MSYDIAIIGSGPAGLTAAIYARRAGLETVIFEKFFPGGQVMKTDSVDNYPAVPNKISGAELGSLLHSHAASFGPTFINEEVIKIDLESDEKIITTSKNVITAKTVIIATGATPRPLDLPAEKRLTGSGISYCATCDGAFFRNKHVAIIGGGNTAVEDALYLANLCEKVYLVHRRDEFRADDILVKRMIENDKIETKLNCIVEAIHGDNMLESIDILNNKTEERLSLEISGMFVAVGSLPQNQLFKDKLELDKGGFIITNEFMQTSLPGVFAAGDVRTTPLRQIVTAAADGAIAANSAVAYLA